MFIATRLMTKVAFYATYISIFATSVVKQKTGANRDIFVV